MKNYEEILSKALTNHYYNNIELQRMESAFGIKLNNEEIEEFLFFKENAQNDLKEELPLISFNSNKIFYYYSKELSDAKLEYLQYIIRDVENNNSTIIMDNFEEMKNSRIASELDGSLKIEGVNTTRKVFSDLIKGKTPKDENEQIAKRMINGLNYVLSKPQFNKENIKILFNIISEIEMNGYYRDDMVEIGNHPGCDIDKIEECMNSLIYFVNEEIKKEKTKNTFFLPFIVHYYILYIHPYDDYNGRMARMISLWISTLINSTPFYISEAINYDKRAYYHAIDDSRYSHNDLTYFITFLITLANKYYMIYKNITEVKKELALIGEGLSETESTYYRIILINMKKGWFNYRGFINFINNNISKQGALKILNSLLEQNLLISKINKKNEKVFHVNLEKLKYDLN